MIVTEVKQLFECIVCNKAWSSKQSLRAHMKVHKGEGYKRTNIFVQSAPWTEFEAFCKQHKTTTCKLLAVLIQATLKGKELGVIDLGSSNPVVINVQNVSLGAPRGRYSHVNVAGLTQAELIPVVCAHIGGFQPGQVYCQNRIYSWLPRSACEGCGQNRAAHNP